MRLAYADPPYPGQAKKRYGKEENYAGEVDHKVLIDKMMQYDGWVLHTASTTLPYVISLFSPWPDDVRILAWVKPFAAFKRNVPVAYAWEPVLVKAARKPVIKHIRPYSGMVYRDWLAENITLKRGLCGVKPEKVCMWIFEMLGATTEDTLDDLYPGTGAVTVAWEKWKGL